MHCMGLLEYQAMPSLPDVAHDGWLCSNVYIYYNSSWEFHQLAAGQLLSGQPVRFGKERPVHHVQNHTCQVTLLQPARRATL
jgi:hypothetical protein